MILKRSINSVLTILLITTTLFYIQSGVDGVEEDMSKGDVACLLFGNVCGGDQVCLDGQCLDIVLIDDDDDISIDERDYIANYNNDNINENIIDDYYNNENEDENDDDILEDIERIPRKEYVSDTGVDLTGPINIHKYEIDNEDDEELRDEIIDNYLSVDTIDQTQLDTNDIIDLNNLLQQEADNEIDDENLLNEIEDFNNNNNKNDDYDNGIQYMSEPQVIESQGIDSQGNQIFSKQVYLEGGSINYEQQPSPMIEQQQQRQLIDSSSSSDNMNAVDKQILLNDINELENGMRAESELEEKRSRKIDLTDDSTIDKLGVHVKDVEEKFLNKIFKDDDQQEELEMAAKSVVDFKNPHIILQTINKLNSEDGITLIGLIADYSNLTTESFDDMKLNGNELSFKVNDNAELVAKQINELNDQVLKSSRLEIKSCQIIQNKLNQKSKSQYFLITIIVIIASLSCLIIILSAIFLIRRRTYLRDQLKNKIISVSKDYNKETDNEKLLNSNNSSNWNWKSWFRSCKDDKKLFSNNNNNNSTPDNNNYKELCRNKMSSISKNGQISPMNSTINTTVSNVNESTRNNSASAINSTPIVYNNNSNDGGESHRSSTSSWSDEPLNTINIDITTGHVILSYMEEHLNEKNRLEKEWQELCKYEAEPNKCDIANQNANKNRYSDILPYDHTRVKLLNVDAASDANDDYINASFIIDNDPKHPAYITTQGPLSQTTADFWQMIWEQNSVNVISLCRTVEYGSLKCHQYWPVSGCEVYGGQFEVHLVSEHVWCEDYLVRSFYLKNLHTNQTRTVTQFHFLTWPENGLPHSIKSILEFRRKINKSHKANSSPIVVHCNDGNGRSGTFILIDMVLNKIARGVKEIDLAATLEFLRDQRADIVMKKDQFEFSFAVVTEELQNMLKAISSSSSS